MQILLTVDTEMPNWSAKSFSNRPTGNLTETEKNSSVGGRDRFLS